MLRKLWEFIACLFGHCASEAVRLVLILNNTPDMAEIRLEPGQSVTAQIKPLDRRGKSAKLDSVPTWESSDSSLVDIQVDPDGLSAIIRVPEDVPFDDSEPVIPVTVTVTADADLDDDEVRVLTGVATILVAQPEAQTFEVSFGEPSDNIENPAE